MAFTVKGTVELDVSGGTREAVKQLESSFAGVGQAIERSVIQESQRAKKIIDEVTSSVYEMTDALIARSAMQNESAGMNAVLANMNEQRDVLLELVTSDEERVRVAARQAIAQRNVTEELQRQAAMSRAVQVAGPWDSTPTTSINLEKALSREVEKRNAMYGVGVARLIDQNGETMKIADSERQVARNLNLAEVRQKQITNEIRKQEFMYARIAKAQGSSVGGSTPFDPNAILNQTEFNNAISKGTYHLNVHRKAVSEVKKEYTAWNQAMGVVTRGLIGMVAFGAMREIGQFSKEIFNLAAEYENLSIGIQKVSNDYDIAAKSISESLVVMSDGILSEADSMKRVNQAALLGGKELAEAMPELFDIVRVNARAMGIDTGYALESMTIGLGRLSARWLDNLGIVIDTRAAYRKLANDLDTTVGQLTDAERRIALVNEVIGKYGRSVEEMGESERTAAENIQAAASATEDWKAAVGAQTTGPVGAISKEYESGMRESAELLRTKEAYLVTKKAIEEYRDELDKADQSIRENYTALTDANAAFRSFTLSGWSNIDSFSPEVIQDMNVQVVLLAENLTGLQQLELAKGLTGDLKDVIVGMAAVNGAFYRTEKAQRAAYRQAEELSDAFTSQESAIDSAKKKMLEAGVSIGKVEKIATDAKGELYVLQHQGFEKLSETEQMAALIQWARDLAVAVDGATLSVQALKWSLPPLMSEFGEYEIQPLSVEALKVAAQMALNRFNAEKAANKAIEADAKKHANEMKKIYDETLRLSESAVLKGLKVTEDDFNPDRLDAPLEAVRRLYDVAKLGTKSPWYEMFEVPEDVVKQGEDAIKRWAQQLANRGADLREIKLIDKDAFLRELGEMEAATREKQEVLNTLTQWAIDAGLSSANAKAYAQEYVGEPSAEGIVEGLKSISEMNAGASIAGALTSSVEEAFEDYMSTGETMATFILQGIESYIKENPLVIPAAFNITEPTAPITYDRGD